MTNARSGERFVWRATRASTNGAYCEFDLYLTAEAKVAAPHRHPRQEERFTVVAGEFALTKAGESSVLQPGDTGVVPADTPHHWMNTTAQASQVVVRLSPALHIEEYFATFCAVATAGKASATGLPRNLLRLAVLLDDHRAEFAFATSTQQRLLSPLVSVLAAIGRLFKMASEPEMSAKH